MSLKKLVEDFQHLPSSTQVVLIVLTLVVVVLLVVYPAAGTSILTFLVGLKMLVSQQSNR